MSVQAHLMVRYTDTAAIADCLDAKLNDELTIQAWGDELCALIENCKKDRLVVNFQSVKFMSSSALRALITLNSKAKAKKVALFLCAIDANILEVFKITKLDSLFKIRGTEQEALHSMI